MTIAVSPAVPADIQPAEVELAMTAILLRAGLYAEAVPAYSDAALIRAVHGVANRLTWRPFRRPA